MDRLRGCSVGILIAAVLGLCWAHVTQAADDELVLKLQGRSVGKSEVVDEFRFAQPAMLAAVRRDDNAARTLAVDWYSNILVAKAAVDDKLIEKQPGLDRAADALRNKFIAKAILARHTEEKVKPETEELHSLMAVNPKLCDAPPRYKVARIGVIVGKHAGEPELAGAKDRILKIKEQIVAGADFAALGEKSSDVALEVRGSDGGWLTEEQLAGLEGGTAVRMLGIGQMSEVVRTSDGYVLFYLQAKDSARRLSFEECRGRLERELRDQFATKLVRDWVNELAQRYEAAFNVDAFVSAVRAVPVESPSSARESPLGAGAKE